MITSVTELTWLFLLAPLFCSWVFIHEKAYQVIDTGIESSVMTKVKGFGRLNHQVMDVADYVYPPQVRFPQKQEIPAFRASFNAQLFLWWLVGC